MIVVVEMVVTLVVVVVVLVEWRSILRSFKYRRVSDTLGFVMVVFEAALVVAFRKIVLLVVVIVDSEATDHDKSIYCVGGR